MTRSTRRTDNGLAALAGLACVACCALPLLIGAGLLGGGTIAALSGALPVIAVALAVAAAAALWWATRRRATHQDSHQAPPTPALADPADAAARHTRP